MSFLNDQGWLVGGPTQRMSNVPIAMISVPPRTQGPEGSRQQDEWQGVKGPDSVRSLGNSSSHYEMMSAECKNAINMNELAVQKEWER